MNKQRLVHKQYQNLSPQQIQFLSLLQNSIVYLEKRIEEELENNPALEEDEHEEINQTLYQKKEGINNFEENQIVEKGQKIGAIGSTGRVTGPHLHWTVYFEKIRINPELIIQENFLKKLLLNRK